MQEAKAREYGNRTSPVRKIIVLLNFQWKKGLD